MTLSATDANGNAVTTFSGWYQGGFNYCDVSPKPSGCPAGTHTDVPTWFDDTATLVGSGSDTHGAAGWFTPTVSLSSLTFTFDKIVGIPTFQTGFAGDGPAAPSATTTAATTVADTTAMLNATVNANYTASTVSFRYALSAAEVTSGQGSVIAAVPGAVAGGDSTAVNAALSGLTAATTYFYRVEVDPGTGAVVTGAVESFTTATPSPAPSIVISGSRMSIPGSHDRITVDGTTKHIGIGTVLTPMVSLDGGDIRPGVGLRMTGADGDFVWTRQVATQRDVTIAFTDGVLTSNTLVFAVTPGIMISGSRDGGRVQVSGVTEHLPRGAELTPIEGVNIRQIDARGEFTWAAP